MSQFKMVNKFFLHATFIITIGLSADAKISCIVLGIIAFKCSIDSYSVRNELFEAFERKEETTY